MKPEDVLYDIFDKKINKNWTFLDIKTYLMGKPYDYGERRAQEYMKMLREYVIDKIEIDNEYDLKEAIEQLDAVAKEARMFKNFKVYLEAKKEIYKLKGMYTEKHEVIIKKIDVIVPDEPDNE